MKRGALLAICASCAQALPSKAPPIESMARPPGAAAEQLLADADAAWRRRSDPAQAALAEDLYLQAARADPKEVPAYAGAIRAKAFRLGRSKDGSERLTLAQDAVGAGQLCEEHAPQAPPCDYWLAAALGLQARERSATATDGLKKMADLLRRAARSDASVDRGGPHRLLATLLLRAPSWPLGPGDPDAALPEAQAAVKIEPAFAPNQLALGEALKANGREAEARNAYREALRLANQAADDPDAKGWIDDANEGLK